MTLTAKQSLAKIGTSGDVVARPSSRSTTPKITK